MKVLRVMRIPYLQRAEKWQLTILETVRVRNTQNSHYPLSNLLAWE
jgi:hypothetical protein